METTILSKKNCHRAATVRQAGNPDAPVLDFKFREYEVSRNFFGSQRAHIAGHFKGRVVATMFKSIYKKLCPACNNQVGRYISHCNDWWGDGSGDMLFIRTGYYRTFEEWARL